MTSHSDQANFAVVVYPDEWRGTTKALVEVVREALSRSVPSFGAGDVFNSSDLLVRLCQGPATALENVDRATATAFVGALTDRGVEARLARRRAEGEELDPSAPSPAARGGRAREVAKTLVQFGGQPSDRAEPTAPAGEAGGGTPAVGGPARVTTDPGWASAVRSDVSSRATVVTGPGHDANRDEGGDSTESIGGEAASDAVFGWADVVGGGARAEPRASADGPVLEVATVEEGADAGRLDPREPDALLSAAGEATDATPPSGGSVQRRLDEVGAKAGDGGAAAPSELSAVPAEPTDLRDELPGRPIPEEELIPSVAAATWLGILVPGGGQVYLGERERGIGYAMVAPLVVPWFRSVVEARALARQIREGERKARTRPTPGAALRLALVFWGLVGLVAWGATALYGALTQPAVTVDSSDAAGEASASDGDGEPEPSPAVGGLAPEGSGGALADEVADRERRLEARRLLAQARLACEASDYALCRQMSREARGLDPELVEAVRLFHRATLALEPGSECEGSGFYADGSGLRDCR